MGLLQDITNDTKRVLGASKVLKEEDQYRRLAVNERKGFRLPIVYSNNDYLLTSNAAWSGFAVANKPWGFLDQSARRSYYYAANALFSRIFPSDKETAGHLILTNRVYTADDWERNLLARYASTASENFARYVKASRKVVEQREFFEREVYLFTRLGARGETGGIRGFMRSLVEFFAVGANMDDSQPELEEQKFWSTQAASMVDTLSNSWLRAEPVHRRRVEWLTRHLDTPGLPTPDVAPADEEEWDAGYWRTVLASYTEEVPLGVSGKNRYHCVEFTAPTGAGKSYAAFLPVNHIPSALHFEQNWIHHASNLPFPVDCSLHFEIIDPDRAEKDLQRPITDAEAQEEEDREAGVRTDDATQLQQRGLRQVKADVQMSRKPLAYWQAVFAVYDTDKEELLSKVAHIIKHYKDIQFELVCPNRDQRELFYQTFPGSDVLVDDWWHRTETEYLAASGPWLTSSVGDREESAGLYQGHTIVRDANGTPQKGVPVFYDLQNVVDDEGRAPTEAITGFPGSGKTVSRGLKIAHEDALRGITQFVWDPKGDFLPLKRYAADMQLDPRKVKLVDLYDPNNSVSLDAMAIAEVDPAKSIDERETSAIDVLFSLCSDYISNPNEGLKYQSVLRQAVTEVLKNDSPETPASMQAVLDRIDMWRAHDYSSSDVAESRQDEWSEYCRMLSNHLHQLQGDTLGRLLFRNPNEAGTVKITEGDLVIFVALKMQVTEPNETPTMKSRISDIISGLMTDFIRSLLFTLPDEVPKSLIFDEWHVIKRTKRAESLVDWLKRMGRSKRCMVRQMSQSASDFTKGSLSTVWCGYAQNDEEAAASCDLLGIEASQANISMLKSLQAGQFLFRDVHGRVAHVYVDIWDDWMLEKFNTSAAAKAALAEELLREGSDV